MTRVIKPFISIPILNEKGIATSLEGSSSEVVPPSGGSFVETVTTLAPITWLRLNETSGTVATNSGSEAIDLTYNADASTADIDPSSVNTGDGSRAKDFSGGLRVQDTGNNISKVSGTELTVEFAIKIDGAVTTANIINSDLPNAQITLRISSSVVFIDILWSTGSKQGFPTNMNLTSYFGQWVYISVSYTPGAQVQNLNGATVRRNGQSSPIFLGDDSDFNMGTNSGSSLTEIDELQVYDKVLTPEEKEMTYNYWANGILPVIPLVGEDSALLAVQNPAGSLSSFDANADGNVNIIAGKYAALTLETNTLSIYAYINIVNTSSVNVQTCEFDIVEYNPTTELIVTTVFSSALLAPEFDGDGSLVMQAGNILLVVIGNTEIGALENRVWFQAYTEEN